MSRIQTAINLLINDPKKLPYVLGRKNLLNWVPDKQYLKMIYYGQIGKKLNLDNPVTFNEKLQWLKLYDRRSEYITYVDKFAIREHIKHNIGEEYLIPLIGVYESVEEIPWDELPNSFVLKCSHGSGCNIICKEKSELNIQKSIENLKIWMNRKYFGFGREWPYKHVKPRILCEEYLVDESGTELKDYKFMCFNGEPKCLFVCLNRNLSGLNVDFYDMDWKPLPFKRHYPRSGKTIEKPINFDKMVEFAKVLSKDIPFIRVDFYEVEGQLYFGELTLYPGNGLEEFTPDKYDELLGSWIQISVSV